MTTTTYPITIEICTDCVSLLANGEVTDSDGEDITEAHAALVNDQWYLTEITLGNVNEDPDDYDVETWFSVQPCDMCGSVLGGDRQYATAWSE